MYHWGRQLSHKQLLDVQSGLIELLADESDKWDVELDAAQGIIVSREGWSRVKLLDADEPPGMDPEKGDIAEFMSSCGIKGSVVKRAIRGYGDGCYRYNYTLPTVQDAFLLLLLQHGYTLFELAQYPEEIETVAKDLISLRPA